jgi:hypothetical protein
MVERKQVADARRRPGAEPIVVHAGLELGGAKKDAQLASGEQEQNEQAMILHSKLVETNCDVPKLRCTG